MEGCLIAPVRAEHVESVMGRVQWMGRVQFGASDKAFFEKLAVGLPVYLFPTKHPVPGAHPAAGQAFLVGTLAAVDASPDPSLRPDATASDTSWSVYWTVEAAPPTGPVPAIGDFRTAAGKPHATTPRRPLLAYLMNH